ncbi:FtsB family cell division protein [Luteibaculum oceani]|uniref:Septum formation initiator family protein n=1 Tax=Luteibaculum oceani TaxID=1294296 RepID=A0A5C6V1M1_9FLAO|nr:septum formation initiator family protein [Luteibaculum oceani]TXC78571.1 hypothetical protein FRX97_07590 [Luteibaculum oceani]
MKKAELRKHIERIPNWMANKYFATFFVFVLFVAFFDSYTFVDLYKWRSDLSRLEEERNYYQDRIEELELDEKNLSSDIKNIEKFAREKYFMKKPNEEIFLIVRDKN